VHALFQPRFAGDNALLELASLRFAQHGLAAELYADTPEQLDGLLRYVPSHPRLPTVHLNRGLNLLHERDRSAVVEFATRFAGRVSGLVVHDHPAMGEQTSSLVTALRELDGRLPRPPRGPMVFLEYAAGLEPGWFVEIAERVKDAEAVSCCIDVGHIGIRQAVAAFARDHPDISLRSLSPGDDRLPAVATAVQQAVRRPVPDVLEMTRAIGRLGKHLHFHLHDGHPLVGGLPDHFTFLTRLPIPFRHDGRQSLDMLYGPAGLAAIVATATDVCGLDQVSFTLEIHQVGGRLPLGDAASLFRHWPDVANAERMNYWLSVLAGNAMLVEDAIQAAAGTDR
jgi:hypothetical protein